MEQNHNQENHEKNSLDRAIDRIKHLIPKGAGRYVVAFAACLIILLLFVTMLRAIDYNPKGKTSLDTMITLMDKDFGAAHGCIAYIEGIVANTGTADANDVTVTCHAKNNNNKNLRSESFFLGEIPYSKERKFTERIDYGCFDGGLLDNIYFECKARCGDGSCTEG